MASVTQYLSPVEKPTVEERDNIILSVPVQRDVLNNNELLKPGKLDSASHDEHN